MSHSGARVTVIDSTGTVLADSAQDPETMENHSNRPEIQQAFASGKGQSVRFSAAFSGNSYITRSVTSLRPGRR